MTHSSLITAKRLQDEIARLTPLAQSAADWRHIADLHIAWEAAARAALAEMHPLRRESLV